jgi:protein-tyrosine phosphatase
MSLRFDQCPNLRDVGLWVNELAGHPILAPKRLFRGGQINDLPPTKLANARTVMNLRVASDPPLNWTQQTHVPLPNHMECYRTQDSGVQRWLQTALVALPEPGGWPVLVHCRSGKDRTSVVVGAALIALGVPTELVIQEYSLSTGKLQPEAFRQAMAHLEKDPLKTFGRSWPRILAKLQPLRLVP